MDPPYDTTEVAEAITDQASRKGLELRAVRVLANTLARVWVLRASSSQGRSFMARLPFSTPEGIFTPAELAERLLREG